MIKVGVIGVGSMGQNHARVYSEIADLQAIADTNEETISRLSQRLDVNGYIDYRELLDRDDIEAVSIATPLSSHHRIAKDALEHDKHVLLEKPITSTVEEAQELIDIANKRDLVFAVGHIERHNPIVGFTRDLLDRRTVGDIISLATRRVSSFPSRIRDAGVIFDLGIHDIDVMRYLVGSEVRSVYAVAGMFNNDEYEDHANIILDFENDKIGFIEANWLTPMKVRRCSLTCSEAFVEVDYFSQSIQVSKSSMMEMDISNLFNIPQKYDIRKMNVKLEEPLKNELSDFIRAIKNNAHPLVSGNDGLQALRIAKAALESSRSKQKIQLIDQ